MPEVLPYFENTEVLTATRVWGDVNGIVLISLGLLWFLGGKMKDNLSKKLQLFGNITIGIILILTASFHHLAPHSGPPPPVFILLTISIIFAFISWRRCKDN